MLIEGKTVEFKREHVDDIKKTVLVKPKKPGNSASAFA